MFCTKFSNFSSLPSKTLQLCSTPYFKACNLQNAHKKHYIQKKCSKTSTKYRKWGPQIGMKIDQSLFSVLSSLPQKSDLFNRLFSSLDLLMSSSKVCHLIVTFSCLLSFLCLSSCFSNFLQIVRSASTRQSFKLQSFKGSSYLLSFF